MKNYIPRTLEKSLTSVSPSRAYMLYGARQVGKTSLLRHMLANQNVEWLTGESSTDRERLQFDTQQDLIDFLKAYKVIVIDEAQYVDGIGQRIKRMIDQHSDSLIFLSGSSSLKLAKGVKESAVGRLDFMTLFPFSVEELVNAKSWDWFRLNFERLLIAGSYPDVVNHFSDDIDSLAYRLLHYVNGVFLQDIYELGGIRKSSTLKHLLRLLATSVGSQISYDGLARDTGLSKQTVVNYLDLLEQNFVIFKLDSFARNIATELKKSKKIYFFDNGVRNALLDKFSPLSRRDDGGALFENFVAAELYKQHSYRKDRTHLYFWRTAQGQEIDFLEVKDDKVQRAIECKLSKNAKVKSDTAFRNAYGVERTVVSPETFKDFYLKTFVPSA